MQLILVICYMQLFSGGRYAAGGTSNATRGIFAGGIYNH